MSLSMLKTAKKVIGAKQTAKALEKDMVSVVYLADDADRRVTRPIVELCGLKDVQVISVPTMTELGQACSIQVGAAAVAVLK